MRRSMVAGNWKMHGSRESVGQLASALCDGAVGIDHADIAVFPPFVFIDQVSQSLKGTNIQVGAQNLSSDTEGAFTGEVSGEMLRDFNCQFALVGHSERRHVLDESDEVVAKKFIRAQDAGLIPVLCLGESLDEREANQTLDVVNRQLDAVLKLGDVTSLRNAVLAYEPVWAIGTGKTATPEQAQEVHAAIRARLSEMDSDIADEVRILYGGSVKSSNAKEIFSMPDIDGGLIGGASLNAHEFLEICQCIK